MKDKITKKNGFTMAELLIVVAIIAVLVAVAIPIFNKQLEKSREAYDIATMRQAASAAVELYYAGVTEGTASSVGLSWQRGSAEEANAYGIYNPSTGKFLPHRSTSNEAKNLCYGKGTSTDGGTSYIMGNDRGAYLSSADYTNAIVMIAIYPNAEKPHVDIYWKNTKGEKPGQYVGGPKKPNEPNYSIRIYID